MTTSCLKPLRWLIALLLFGGCYGPEPVDADVLMEPMFGPPVVVDQTLHIPMTFHNYPKVKETANVLCGVQSTRAGRTIELRMSKCSTMPNLVGKNIQPMKDPTISVPYDGPGAYRVVFVDSAGQTVDLGEVEVPSTNAVPSTP